MVINQRCVSALRFCSQMNRAEKHMGKKVDSFNEHEIKVWISKIGRCTRLISSVANAASKSQSFRFSHQEIAQYTALTVFALAAAAALQWVVV